VPREQIFRQCCQCFRELRFSPAAGQSRVREEYLVDFELVARRNLSSAEFLILRARLDSAPGAPGSRSPVMRRIERRLNSAFLRERLIPVEYFGAQR
jgi:hypothetical protein